MATGIQYIRDQIPEGEIPPYRGQRYRDMVPDTLDLVERIELAVNGVTGPTDPEADHEIYFWVNFFREPPVMTHKWDDWCQPKFMEALPLLRAASGSGLNDEVDESWKMMLLRSIGRDGLFYRDGAFINRRTYTREGQAAPAQELVAAARASIGETVPGGHFHSHTICLLNLVEYGLVAGDRDLLDFCGRSYEWARLQGSTLTGFFPTVINPQFFDAGLPYSGIRSPWYDEFEICELADMIAIALKLSAGGVGDYYDDVDRWARNYFAEGQLTRIDWIETRPRYMETRPLFANETSERVGARSRGGFAGWMSGSDWATRMGITQCCTGNAARSLYYLWEHQLEEGKDSVQVNLRLNRAGRLVDVHGWEPYEGCVAVKAKASLGSLRVRAPEWVASGSSEVQVGVDGAAVPVSWSGRYVEVGPVGAGSVVRMVYGQPRYMVKEQLGDGIYTLTLKGSTVVDIDPPGRHCPLFQRAHYREDAVRWRQVERFVPDDPVTW